MLGDRDLQRFYYEYNTGEMYANLVKFYITS